MYPLIILNRTPDRFIGVLFDYRIDQSPYTLNQQRGGTLFINANKYIYTHRLTLSFKHLKTRFVNLRRLTGNKSYEKHPIASLMRPHVINLIIE